MRSGMRLVIRTLVAVTALAVPASAQDVQAGYIVAKRSCSGCHEIGKSAVYSDMSPSFETIARRPSTTTSSLNMILSIPHYRMPDYLTRQEIADVSAYVLSLK